jgi:hypothetical protein
MRAADQPWRLPREPGIAVAGVEPYGTHGPHSVGMAGHGNNRRAKYYTLTVNEYGKSACKPSPASTPNYPPPA